MKPITLNYDLEAIRLAIEADAQMCGEIQKPLRKDMECETVSEFVRDADDRITGATATTKFDSDTDDSPLECFRLELARYLEAYTAPRRGRRGIYLSPKVAAEIRDFAAGTEMAEVFTRWQRACEMAECPINRGEIQTLVAAMLDICERHSGTAQLGKAFCATLELAISENEPDCWPRFFDEYRMHDALAVSKP